MGERTVAVAGELSVGDSRQWEVIMASNPDGLWPRKTDAASDGLDENREIDDIELTLDEDLPPTEEEAPEWMIDADQRPVDLDDEDEDRETGEPGVEE
ncbi:MAG TPA: hypothetical protein VLO31_01775 [Cryobacterium sp.]|nr:hypothetical protein [Cryobacterium sp.]